MGHVFLVQDETPVEGACTPPNLIRATRETVTGSIQKTAPLCYCKVLLSTVIEQRAQAQPVQRIKASIMVQIEVSCEPAAECSFVSFTVHIAIDVSRKIEAFGTAEDLDCEKIQAVNTAT